MYRKKGGLVCRYFFFLIQHVAWHVVIKAFFNRIARTTAIIERDSQDEEERELTDEPAFNSVEHHQSALTHFGSTKRKKKKYIYI